MAKCNQDDNTFTAAFLFHSWHTREQSSSSSRCRYLHIKSVEFKHASFELHQTRHGSADSFRKMSSSDWMLPLNDHDRPRSVFSVAATRSLPIDRHKDRELRSRAFTVWLVNAINALYGMNTKITAWRKFARRNARDMESSSLSLQPFGGGGRGEKRTSPSTAISPSGVSSVNLLRNDGISNSTAHTDGSREPVPPPRDTAACGRLLDCRLRSSVSRRDEREWRERRPTPKAAKLP